MFFVYMLRCRDGSLYTGITNNLEKRLEKHSSGKGSRYVRSRLPFRMVYSEETPSKESAMRREREIKSMRRQGKMDLIARRNMSV